MVSCNFLALVSVTKHRCSALLTNGGNAYHDQKATKNPNHEKKNTLPYMLIGFRKGIARALRVMGLTSGAPKAILKLTAIVKIVLLVTPPRGYVTSGEFLRVSSKYKDAWSMESIYRAKTSQDTYSNGGVLAWDYRLSNCKVDMTFSCFSGGQGIDQIETTLSLKQYIRGRSLSEMDCK